MSKHHFVRFFFLNLNAAIFCFGFTDENETRRWMMMDFLCARHCLCFSFEKIVTTVVIDSRPYLGECDNYTHPHLTLRFFLIQIFSHPFFQSAHFLSPLPTTQFTSGIVATKKNGKRRCCVGKNKQN